MAALAAGTARPARLDDWVDRHGPFSPAEAVSLALEVAAQATRMRYQDLRSTVGSLTAAEIERPDAGEWRWVPSASDSPRKGVTDADVLERIGAVLFHAIAAAPAGDLLASAAAVHARLRHLRPDVPAPIAELVLSALTARQHGALTIKSFTDRCRAVLGVPAHASARRRHVSLAAAVILLGAAGLSWWAYARAAANPVQSHGVTEAERVLLDLAAESASTFARIDEHTAAIQTYQQAARIWRSRLPADDPRLAWNEVHEAWVRTLAGDRLTAEQYLQIKPDWLTTALGESHPYTRVARLGLAATLDARRAHEEAASIRRAADRALASLVPGERWPLLEWSDLPPPQAVLAHLAPNTPEREGFRLRAAGEYRAPLTSLQYWHAARQGWRLHLAAHDGCRVAISTPAGTVSVEMAGEGDGRTWSVAGVTLPARPTGDVTAVSIVADENGQFRAHTAGEIHSLDHEPATPALPYSLAFAGDTPDACALVWLEIAIPERFDNDASSGN